MFTKSKCVKNWARLGAITFAALFTVGAGDSFGQGTPQLAEAKIPVRINVAANISILPRDGIAGTGDGPKTFAPNVWDTLYIMFNLTDVSDDYHTSISNGRRHEFTGPATIRQSRGNITLELSPLRFANAEVSLFSVNGRRILRNNVSAANGTSNISRRSVAAGIYLLSVKGTNGNVFTTKLNHRGGSININLTFERSSQTLDKSIVSNWSLTATATGHSVISRAIHPMPGVNDPIDIIISSMPPPADFIEDKVPGQTFEMIYIPGGTINLGCQGGGCYYASTNVNATVSPYYIAKNQVSQNLWRAVMGSDYPVQRPGDATWYESNEFACKLSQITGRSYRMMTEAEFEYAAVNHSSSLGDLNTANNMQGEEWAYNSWSSSHSGGTDPVGPTGDAPLVQSLHDQKTRRNAAGVGDHIRGRLIRSIEGIGPQTRLVLSANGGFPPNYVPPCNIGVPHMDDSEWSNSYRDPRWVTGSDSAWIVTGMMAQNGLNTEIRVWANGAASITNRFGNYPATATNGQWFSSNNINFVFVPNSGSVSRYAYIFVDARNMSVISAGSNSYTGRMWKVAATNVNPPNVTNLAAGGEELARRQPNFETDYKMVDMVNMPQSVRGQDLRLFDESTPGAANYGWAQINQGSAHHYRKDIDADEFRFVVSGTMLSNGSWFTINNTFLRVRHPGGSYQVCYGQFCQNVTYEPYEVDYLYVFTDNDNFMHNSFQGYERGDYRRFERLANSDSNWQGMGEVEKGQGPSSMYSTHRLGQSTFRPAPCPAGGCN